MECTFDTCVDKGRQSKLSWERVVCGKCGKVKPLYNVSEQGTANPKPSVSQLVQQVLTSYLKGGNSICRCKETFQEWFLSLLGLGYSEYYAKCDESILQKENTFQLGKSQGKDRKFALENIRRTSKVNLQNSPSYIDRIPFSEVSLANELLNSFEFQQTDYEYCGVQKKIRGPSESTLKKGFPARKQNLSKGGLHPPRRDSKSTESSDISTKILSNLEHFDKKVADTTNFTHSTDSSSTDVVVSKSRSKKRSKQSAYFFNPFKNRIRYNKCPRIDILKSLYCPQLPCICYHKPKPAALIDNLVKDDRSDKSEYIISIAICKDSNTEEEKKKSDKKFDSLEKFENDYCNKTKEQDNSPCRSLKQSEKPFNLQPERAELFAKKLCTETTKNTKKQEISPGRSFKQSEKPIDSQPKGEKASIKKKSCTEVTKSSSMPCTSCFGTRKPLQSRFCSGIPHCTCRAPSSPCRSNSFYSTWLRSASRMISTTPKMSPFCRPCAVSTGRPRCRKNRSPGLQKFANVRSGSFQPCKCGGKSPFRSSPSRCRGNGPSNLRVPRKSTCASKASKHGSKPPARECPPYCIKPCCLPVTSTAFSYCQKVDSSTAKQYLNIPPHKLSTACPCPLGKPCSCAKKKKQSSPCCNNLNPAQTCKVACSSLTARSYIKSKQNDAICQRLIRRYGFSKPPCVHLPDSCYGQMIEEMCPSSACTEYFSCVGSFTPATIAVAPAVYAATSSATPAFYAATPAAPTANTPARAVPAAAPTANTPARAVPAAAPTANTPARAVPAAAPPAVPTAAPADMSGGNKSPDIIIKI